MADDKKLAIPPAIYDYVLYYECAQKDWLDYRKRSQVKGDGSLMDSIKWDVTFTIHPNDTGGATKFGIIATVWESFVKSNPSKGYNKDLNSVLSVLYPLVFTLERLLDIVSKFVCSAIIPVAAV